MDVDLNLDDDGLEITGASGNVGGQGILLTPYVIHKNPYDRIPQVDYRITMMGWSNKQIS